MKSYFIRGMLVFADGAVHVGTGKPGVGADLVVMRDAADMPYIPGTSLAGALRSRCSRLKSYDTLASLFGPDREREEGGSLWASRLIVRDAWPLVSVSGTTVTRVALDPETRTAKRHHLFTTEALPRGMRFEFALRLDEREENDESGQDANAWEALKSLLADLRHNGLAVGGDISSGEGRASVTDLEIMEFDWNNPGHLAELAGCDHERPFAGSPLDTGFLNEVPARLSSSGAVTRTLEIGLVPVEPLMIGTDRDTEPPVSTATPADVMADQAQPDEPGHSRGEWEAGLRDTDAGFVRRPDQSETMVPVVLGSSLRGALRARAAQILSVFPNQVTVDQVFGSTDNGSRVYVGHFWPADPQAFERRLKLQDFVAVDRWTGGAADAKKFDARPYYPEVPPPADLTQNAGLLEGAIELDEAPAWVEGLVYLLLRDLDQGLVRIGCKRSIGWGKVRVLVKNGTWQTWAEYYADNESHCDEAVGRLREEVGDTND